MYAMEAGLFAALKVGDPGFRRLAEEHRDLDRKIITYDRIYYLTSEQERKRKELQKRQATLRDEMSRIMRLHAERNDRNGGSHTAAAG